METEVDGKKIVLDEESACVFEQAEARLDFFARILDLHEDWFATEEAMLSDYFLCGEYLTEEELELAYSDGGMKPNSAFPERQVRLLHRNEEIEALWMVRVYQKIEEEYGVVLPIHNGYLIDIFRQIEAQISHKLH